MTCLDTAEFSFQHDNPQTIGQFCRFAEARGVRAGFDDGHPDAKGLNCLRQRLFSPSVPRTSYLRPPRMERP